MPCKHLYKNKRVTKHDYDVIIVKCKHAQKIYDKNKKPKDGFPSEVDILKRTYCLTDTGGCQRYEEPDE